MLAWYEPSIYEINMTRFTLFTALMITLSGCQSTQLSNYANNTPELIPRQFFEGKLCAHGVVKSYSGKAIRTMNAQILASWDTQGVGKLDEVFLFKDIGTNKQSRETRVWTLKPTQQKNIYSASAGDVVGETQLQAAGNAINMTYTLRYAQPDKLDSNGEPKTIDIQMDDWMYLVNPTTVINTTKMTKFGIGVGEVVLTIQKVSDETTCI